MTEQEGGPAGSAHDLGPALELELDELLAQLIDRAQDVRSAQHRIQGLLRANRSIVGDLGLETVLRRIVEAACELLEARYGALGVLSPDGSGLEQFIHVGIDAEQVATIGHLPQGKGVLGALIEHPSPIRLHELADDPRSVGFPANHPPMHTFLGVPITVRGEVFGNLYLTERTSGGDFSAQDVELASALAATAAIAIENARLFEEARSRQEWLAASTELAVETATASADEAVRSAVERVHRLAGADVVTLVVPDGEEQLRIVDAVGDGADVLVGFSYPLRGTLTEVVLTSGEPVRVSPEEHTDLFLHLRETFPIGAVMLLPLAGPDGVRGAVAVGRLTPGRAFSESEMEMASAFASQAALALELVESRARQAKMQLFEERDRIARDLHDHVIQQLFAAGLTLQGISMGLGDPAAAERISGVVDSLDLAIQQIRNSIFELKDHAGPQGTGARSAVLDVVAQIGRTLGFDPEVRFSGPVDTIVDGSLAEDVVAVVREALTNIVKHAGASSVEISLTASPERVELRIADDGKGIGAPARRSGLDNMAARATRRDGTFTATAQHDGTGTVLLWASPAIS